MLSVLKIRNIAIIETAEIAFSGGFHVLTGETGAGKSIILDAINAVLGYRTSKELIRTGEREAQVDALFSAVGPRVQKLLAAMGFPVNEDETLLLSRTITADKNLCRVNGALAAVSSLREIGALLIQIHGQQDNHALLDSATHLSYVDAVADDGALLADYTEKYKALCEAEALLRRLSENDQEKARKLDLLRYQINELETAKLQAGEWDKLRARREELRNFEKIRAAFAGASALLSGGENGAGGVSMVGGALRALSEVEGVSGEAHALFETLSEQYYTLEDAAQTLSSLADGEEFSPEELAEIEERADLLFRLSKKYGDTEEEMLSFLENAGKEYEEISFSGERIAALKKECEQRRTACSEAAAALSKVRRKAAKAFCDEVCAQLRFLDMPHVEFLAQFRTIALSQNGTDEVAFYISANVGEVPKPLEKIASGGELSRIMLAIKSVLSERDSIPTLIFDEIDTGVSGHAARRIAEKLRDTSRGKQVICVTHLPQLASFAGTHMLITKSVADQKTYTAVTALDYEGRIRELARIISGGEPTELQLQNAREMLELSGVYQEEKK